MCLVRYSLRTHRSVSSCLLFLQLSLETVAMRSTRPLLVQSPVSAADSGHLWRAQPVLLLSERRTESAPSPSPLMVWPITFLPLHGRQNVAMITFLWWAKAGVYLPNYSWTVNYIYQHAPVLQVPCLHQCFSFSGTGRVQYPLYFLVLWKTLSLLYLPLPLYHYLHSVQD